MGSFRSTVEQKRLTGADSMMPSSAVMTVWQCFPSSNVVLSIGSVLFDDQPSPASTWRNKEFDSRVSLVLAEVY